MNERSAREAAGAYRVRIARTLDCITGRHVQSSGTATVGQPLRLSLDGYRPVQLRGQQTLFLRVRLTFHIEADQPSGFFGMADEYSYSIDDEDQREIISYQMHTIRDTDRRHCHLHLGPGAGDLKPHLFKKHLPSGQVALAEIVWLLIEEYGVTPRRPGWREVLGGMAG